LRDIPSGCLSLTRLVIEDIFGENFNDVDNLDSSIILPSLEYLQIFIDVDDGTSYIDEVLLAISAPSLEFLFIDHVIEKDLLDVAENYPQLQVSDRVPCLRISIRRSRSFSALFWSVFLPQPTSP
jgi:hypothetical protein